MIYEEKKVEIEITPKQSTIHESFTFRIQTHAPYQAFSVHLSTEDDTGEKFTSWASYLANDQGVIEPGEQAPIEGAYEGVDPYGLFWSMTSKNHRFFQKHQSDPLLFQIALYKGNEKIVSHKITRTCHDLHIVKERIEAQIVGTLFYPQKATSLPAVILLGGSDGAIHEGAAALLASEGYVVLALAYFAKGDLPKGLVNIPLEYLAQAVAYLKKLPQVDKMACGLIGFSRGAEYALLYAAYHDNVQSVIGVAPSAFALPGIVKMQPVNQAAWTYKNVPLPYMPIQRTFRDSFSFFKHWMLRKPYSGIEVMERPFQKHDRLIEGRIPVEQIQAPLLLMAGKDDQVQPTELFTKLLEKRLENHRYASKNQVVYYENAGHFAMFPGQLPKLPPIISQTQFQMKVVFGGKRSAHVYATEDSWKRILHFLKQTLKN